MEDLYRVFTCLSVNQYYIEPPKCHFCCRYITAMGSILGNGVIAMDPIKVEAIDNWVVPKTHTDLRSFLGMANYLKTWYKDYSEQSAVLTQLLKKGRSVEQGWGPEQQKAFETLKQGFKRYPILRLPDFTKPFVVLTDACDVSLGGVCAQEYECQNHKGEMVKMLLPVAYHSRTFNKHEVNYPVRERECLGIIDSLKKWEYLLVGAPFKIVIKTDHSTIRQLNQTAGGDLTNKRMARWAEYLGGMDYVIEWVPGRDHLMADGVSRSLEGFPNEGLKPINRPENNITMPSVCNVSARYDQRLEKLDYSKSADFGEIYALLGDETLSFDVEPKVRYYERLNNKLYYTMSNGNMSLCIPEGHHINIPNSKIKLTLREVLLSECHDSPYMGHRGINGTYLQMRTLFYWPKLSRDVGKYVRSCKICKRAKATTTGDSMPLHPNECPVGPFHSVSMDFITGLPSVNGISQVLVVVDRFTKKIFAIPLPTKTSALETATALFENIFRDEGWPLEIISDRDVKFTSALWRHLFDTVGTKLSFSYAYHQRFDGQTEVMNRVLEDSLRAYIDFDQTNWLINLPHVVAAINNAVHPNTLMTPNQIYHGRKHLRPIDLKYGITTAPTDLKQFLETIVHNRAVAEETVRTAIVHYTIQHNKGVTQKDYDFNPKFNPGNTVFVKASHITMPGFKDRESNKLQPKNVGPFTVLKRVGHTGVELEMPGYGHSKKFHVKNLIPYQEELDFREHLRSGDHTRDGEVLWVIDRLAARASRRRRVYYFVLYEGFPVEEGAWMSRVDLMEDCPVLVEEYDFNHPYGSRTELRKAAKKLKRETARKIDAKMKNVPEPEKIAPRRSARLENG